MNRPDRDSMVIPVGEPFMNQELLLIEEGAEIAPMLPVRFIPLAGPHE